LSEQRELAPRQRCERARPQLYRARREQFERWTVIGMQNDWKRIFAFNE